MPAVEHARAIKLLKPKTLIDVGANKGQFSLVARYLFPEIEIHAFEPLQSEGARYQRVVAAPVKYYPMALGSETGEKTLFIASRADSSSLLPLGAPLKNEFGVTPASTVTVPVRRLSDIIDLSELPRPIMIKIDVQGGELDVLKGVDASLDLVDAIYCEVSFMRFYEQQPLANDIKNYLESRGFSLKGMFNQTINRSHLPLQADFMFVSRRA